MNVLVLGAGPAGLLAAHAVELSGANVTIMSLKKLSPMGGAQYLHTQIPKLTSNKPDGEVTYVKMGTPDEYAEKVYGDPDLPTSFEHFHLGEHPCWSLADAYNKLVNRFWTQVVNTAMRPEALRHLLPNYDLVLCSIPAPSLCTQPLSHHFNSVQVALTQEQLLDVPDTILYSGRSRDKWYRTSTIFGKSWTEYPAADFPTPFGSKSFFGKKPLDTDCNCFEDWDNFVRIGRFGRWKRRVLTSDAYDDTAKLLNSMPASTYQVPRAYRAGTYRDIAHGRV